MENKTLHILQIDKEFKSLIRPLSLAEYKQLEQNLQREGCLSPIVTWHNIIVDGHNRYEICHKYNIPFHKVDKNFACREEAIAWICANQLGRRNISDETRKYLIGLQYESEKVINTNRNRLGINQYTYTMPNEPTSNNTGPSGHRTALRIAEEHHISWNTVNKYAAYAKAIAEIEKKAPDVAELILSGQLKISHENISEMASLTANQIRIVMERIKKLQEEPYVRYKQTRTQLQNITLSKHSQMPDGPSVKDMPKFDPDAELTSLTLTIPSWKSTLQRTKEKADMRIATCEAKQQLISALEGLLSSIETILSVIKED